MSKSTQKALKDAADKGTKEMEEYNRQGTIRWLPIEDAPKDGQDIIIFEENTGVIAVAHFDKDSKDWVLSWYFKHVAYDYATHFAYINPPETPHE